LTHTGGFSITAYGMATWWGTRIVEIRFEYVLVKHGAVYIGREAFGPDERFATDDHETVRLMLSDAGFVPESDEGRRLGNEILSAVRPLRRHKWPSQTTSAGYRYLPEYRTGFVEGVLFWIAAALVAGRFIDRWHWRRRERALARKEQLLRDLGLAA